MAVLLVLRYRNSFVEGPQAATWVSYLQKKSTNFPKINSHLKILGITPVSWSYILRAHKILGTTIKNLVLHDLSIPDLQKCINGNVVGQQIRYVWYE